MNDSLIPEERARRSPVTSLVAAAAALVALGLLAMAFGVERPGSREAARRAAEADVRNIVNTVRAFAEDTGRPPTEAEGLDVLAAGASGVPGWNGPYTDRRPTDPWGEFYVYRVVPAATGGGFRVIGKGRDRTEGTDDDVVGTAPR